MVAAGGRLRRSGQTAREFAEELAQGPIAVSGGVEAVAVRVTNLYYAVRFGRQEPDLDEVVRIERELDQADLCSAETRNV